MVALLYLMAIAWHELGHLAAALYCKMRVTKLCIFFDPGFSVAHGKIFGIEFSFGWIPTGGYIQIDTFENYPKRDKLIVASAGIATNLFIGAMVLLEDDYCKILGIISLLTALYNCLPTENSDGSLIAELL